MAFRIVANPTFRVKVPLTKPGADARGVVEIEYRHKGREAFAAWWASIVGRTDAEILGDVIAGWSDVIDDKGEQVAYTPEARALLLEHPAMIKRPLLDRDGELTLGFKADHYQSLLSR